MMTCRHISFCVYVCVCVMLVLQKKFFLPNVNSLSINVYVCECVLVLSLMFYVFDKIS